MNRRLRQPQRDHPTILNTLKDHYNPLGSVHGGYIAAMLDSAIALAVYTVLPTGAGYTTTDLKITYIRALFAASTPVRAEGTVMNQGRRLVLGEARVTDREGRLCAHATATCMVLEPGDKPLKDVPPTSRSGST